MPFASINGIELYYETHGEGEPLVFAHGAGGNHISWWQQVPHFRARYKCITFDHRGFGRSVDPPGGPGGAAFVKDLSALLDLLDLERVNLVAQSMGGWTALGFTLDHPGRVRTLVMADTYGGLISPELDALRASARPGAGSVIPPLASRAVGPTFIAEKPAGAFLYAQISGLNPAHPEGPPTRGMQRPVDATAAAGMQLPVLFLVGEEDQLTPPETIRLAAKMVPRARFELIPRAGHSVYFERPEVFNRLVQEFLEAQP